MSDFKERLAEEKDQLTDRIDKLHAFLMVEDSGQISEIQRSLLNIQLMAMQTYMMCLIQRMNMLLKESK